MSPQDPSSSKAGPAIVPEFSQQLDRLAALAKQGHRPDSPLNNPSDAWLVGRMPILQDLPQEQQKALLAEAQVIGREAEAANAEGRAAKRAWPDVVVRLDTQGLGFFSQLGVARRPDLTRYFVDGFARNRDALAFSEEDQALFTQVFEYVNDYMERQLQADQEIIQSDRQIADVPGRSYHARQLLFGVRYLQIPLMWRQLTFDLPGNLAASRINKEPDIVEVSIPHWLDDLGLPPRLKDRLQAAGMTQLVFKAPTKGLSLHLGFDYVGEHKMGPLSIAMFLVKQKRGLAIQGAVSLARARTIHGPGKTTALVTIGPSLHGKSTLTIMLELANTELTPLLGLTPDPDEGVYPMNDDIVLLQPLDWPIQTTIRGRHVTVPYGIDGTENNFYAMPSGLNTEDDPITFEAVRGTKDAPNSQEILENVPVVPKEGNWEPDFFSNPVRNMRVTLSRSRLITRKGTRGVIEAITGVRERDPVHVPMEHTDRVFWQAVMRQNTIIPPLRRATLKQYIRILMYGEAVQMGAATGVIGRPYVEYFSDPFIIGLEDDNANLMFHVLQELEQGGMPQEYYVFNTGGVGADSNDEASGPRYKKIPRELTLMLQEALLREAVKFEHDPILGSDVAVAIVDGRGREAVDLRQDWLPRGIYGEQDYARRMVELSRRRYYGRDAEDKAGILRYTKVANELYDLSDIPAPANERELAWLLSFCWNVDRAYDSLQQLSSNRKAGKRPAGSVMRQLAKMYRDGAAQGLSVSGDGLKVLSGLGMGD